MIQVLLSVCRRRLAFTKVEWVYNICNPEREVDYDEEEPEQREDGDIVGRHRSGVAADRLRTECCEMKYHTC